MSQGQIESSKGAARSGQMYVVNDAPFKEVDLRAESAWWNALPLQGFHIGDVWVPNRFLLAPMCNVTNLPYRILARREGAALLATEMLSSVALVDENSRTFQMMEFLPEESPIMVQISGSDPETMLRAAIMVEESGASILNLNCGCPVKKIIRGGSGSALLKNPEILRGILRTLRPRIRIPLTVKMRAGWDDASVNAVEVSRMCEDEGVDAVMLHPRTRRQQYEGVANWDLIAEVKSRVGIPVVGNGDIFQAEDAFRMMAATDCDAVMIGRGAMGNPWIFRDCIRKEISDEPATSLPPIPGSVSHRERYDLIRRHVDYYISYAGEAFALKSVRKQLLLYVAGMPGLPAFRARLPEMNTRRAFYEALSTLFGFPAEEYEEVLDGAGFAGIEHESP